MKIVKIQKFRIGQAKNLRDAIQRGEFYVKNEKPDVLPLIKLSTGWRKAPASEKQLKLIQKWGIEVPEGITRGQASHVISMLTLAGKGRRKQETGSHSF